MQLLTYPAYNISAWITKKIQFSVAVQLLLIDGMMYSIVACAAIGKNCAESAIPLLLFTRPLPSNGRLL
jgi:hypothetical protein